MNKVPVVISRAEIDGGLIQLGVLVDQQLRHVVDILSWFEHQICLEFITGDEAIIRIFIGNIFNIDNTGHILEVAQEQVQ